MEIKGTVKISGDVDVGGDAARLADRDSENRGSEREEQGGGGRRRPRSADNGSEVSNGRQRRAKKEGWFTRTLIKPIRQEIKRITGKEIAVLIGGAAGLGLGITVALVGIPKAYNYLTSTKWENRDTGLDGDGDSKCLSILERTRGRAMLIYNCTTKKTEWCAEAGEEPVILHNGISEMSFGNYKAVTKPESSDCEGGYKETILKPK